MNVKPQDLVNAGIGSVSFLAKATFDGIERLAALNLSAGRSFVEASFANFSALAGTTDIRSFVEKQKELAMTLRPYSMLCSMAVTSSPSRPTPRT